MKKFDIKKDTIKSILSSYKIIVPDFQRKLSWGDDKKIELIDSLVNGFPIGAFTLFSSTDEQAYYLVDGLQRYNTIISYLYNPIDILPFNSYFELIQNSISDFCRINTIDAKKIKKAIKEWYTDLATNNNGDMYDVKYKFEDFLFLFKCLENNKIILDISKFQSLREILLRVLDIRDEVLALITYSGPEDDLPEIFTKINQKNVSLTPYEILHSMWYKYLIDECDSNGENYKKYFEKYIEENKEYKTTEITRFNVFMYMTALSYLYEKQIQKNQIFYSKMKNVVKKEVVFDAFSLVMSQKSNKINSVMQGLCKNKEKDEYQQILFDIGSAIISTFELLNEYLVQKEVDFISSKYLYLYLFYIKFRNKYEINFEMNKLYEVKGKIYIDEFFIKRMDELNWFKGENRQLTFFNEKIEKIDELIKTKTKIDLNDLL